MGIALTLFVAVSPRVALADHEDYTCADWGTCEEDYSGIIETLSGLLQNPQFTDQQSCYEWDNGYVECW